MTQVTLAIDKIQDKSFILPEQRYGLVTAAHARTSDGVSSRKVIQENCDLRYLFSPEHGLEGVAAAGKEVDSSVDAMTGLPVCSLYNHNPEKSAIPEEIAKEIDAFIYDLPDVGTRFYTYIATCLQILNYCAENNKKLYILDRPNPLGGVEIEGMCLEEEDYSFIGPYSLPNRYGLTIAELVKLYVEEQGVTVDLEVVLCEGWKRDMLFPETGQVFVIPSPNIPSWEAALLYPGTCLIEGTNMSEGRGTGRPFTWFGAPYIDQEELASALQEINHPGLAIRPQGYIPSFSKNKDLHCKGVSLEITDARIVRPVRFMVEAIAVVRKLYPDEFRFLQSGNTSVAFIHRHMGRKFVDEGWQVEQYLEIAKKDEQDFQKRVESILLYQ